MATDIGENKIQNARHDVCYDFSAVVMPLKRHIVEQLRIKFCFENVEIA